MAFALYHFTKPTVSSLVLGAAAPALATESHRSNLPTPLASQHWPQLFVIVLLIVFAALFIIGGWFYLRKKSFRLHQQQYVHDNFFGVIWRWHWQNSKPVNLKAHCPACDSELVYDDSSCHQEFADERRTELLCERCGSAPQAIAYTMNAQQMQALVESEILKMTNSPQTLQMKTKLLH